MAFYRQNAAQAINQQPVSDRQGTRGVTVYAPEMRQPNMVTATSYTSFGGYSPEYRGGGRGVNDLPWDGLGGRLMDTPQADMYNAEPCPANATGVWDEPNAWQGVIPLIRLQPTTSAHPGAGLDWTVSPPMLFHPPPVTGMQAHPILALGV